MGAHEGALSKTRPCCPLSPQLLGPSCPSGLILLQALLCPCSSDLWAAGAQVQSVL